MNIYKETVDGRKQVAVESRGKKFIMGWFAGDLYWIMQNYEPAYFLITKKTPYFYDFFEKLFKEYHFKNCTLTWSSEAGIDRTDNKLKITKGENYFKIRFFQGENDNLSKSTNTCPVCFCLSGSKHQKIANEFSSFLHTLLNSD